jgi:hypothetical protein
MKQTADSIIGLINDATKNGKTVTISFRNKEYEIIKFMHLNYKTITFQIKPNIEKIFKHKDELIIINNNELAK